ncbi:MAG: hypothetical protein O2930_00670 [Acidobacteria bacterium]|nr:hypothetical protein [Acidobacteriota bacterium]
MADRAISSDDLVRLLEQRHLPPAGATHTADVTREQVDILIARIASLTEALRDAAEDDTARLASRMLLEDLALVVAQFRGRANELVDLLTRARDGIRSESDGPEPSVS